MEAEMEIIRESIPLPGARVRAGRLPRRIGWRRLKDSTAGALLALLAGAVGLTVAAIAALLAQRSWPQVQEVGIAHLLTGQVWQPHKTLFGFAPFLAGSAAVTLTAMALAVVPAVLAGV